MEKQREPCEVDNCDKPRVTGTNPLCNMHYLRKRKGQDMNAPSRRAPHTSPLVQELVEQGASLMEIERTTGVDPRTIKKHYPYYPVSPVGSPSGTRTIRRLQATIDKLWALEEGHW